MRKVISTALLALLMVAACANPQVSTGAETASITVSVSDASAKTIAPETSSATHYKLSLDNAATGTHAESGFLAKGESFTAFDVPAGTWTATADAYIKTGSAGTDDDYTKIATGTSTETPVTAGSSSTISVSIDEYLDLVPGDITLTLDFGINILGGVEYFFSYRITGTGQRKGYSYSGIASFIPDDTSTRLQTVNIDVSEISPTLYQGAYIIEIAVSNVESQITEGLTAKAPNVNTPWSNPQKAADLLILLAGQNHSGTIMLSNIETPKKKLDQPSPAEDILSLSNFFIQGTYIIFYGNPGNTSSISEINLEIGICKKSDSSTISWTQTVGGENLRIGGLTKSTEYLVYARYPGNEEYNESQIIGPLSITTLKFDDPSGGPEIP